MGVVAKRSSMIFYSDPRDHYSHRVRIVLAEKGVAVDVVNVNVTGKLPDDVLSLSPYSELPMLVDRDLALYEPGVMMEYLDERFPHPPLLPVYPVERARSRMWLYRIERDWGSLISSLMRDPADDPVVVRARKSLSDSFMAIDPVFSEKPFFMSDEYTLVDCSLGAIFWRLPAMGIDLPKSKSKHLLAYADRIFKREAFKASLSEAEREMRSR